MSGAEFRGRVMAHRPNRNAFWVAGAAALVVVGAAFASNTGLVIAGVLALIGAMFFGLSQLSARKKQPRDVVIGDTGITIDQKPFAWREISYAEIAADQMLVLSLRGRDKRNLVELSPAERSQMAAILDALKEHGIAPRTGAAGYAHWFRYFMAPAIVVLKAPYLHINQYIAGIVVLYLCALGIASLAARTSIEVGSDGVRLISNSSTRFLSFASIAGVATDDPSLVFTPVDGSTLRFSCAGAIKKEERGARIDELVQTIETARARHSQALNVAASELTAPSQEVQAWKVRIKTDAGSGYRSASETTDHLREVVEHPAASPSARVAAAVKWARSGDEEAKTRIRFAAAETASPRLRIALEKASAGEEDAALDEALEAEKLTRG